MFQMRDNLIGNQFGISPYELSIERILALDGPCTSPSSFILVTDSGR
jgi:hypothetical protein